MPIRLIYSPAATLATIGSIYTPTSADKVLRKAFERADIQGASTHSFRRTALTLREQRRDWAADYSRNQRSQQPRTIAARRKR
jgi:integrase